MTRAELLTAFVDARDEIFAAMERHPGSIENRIAALEARVSVIGQTIEHMLTPDYEQDVPADSGGKEG